MNQDVVLYGVEILAGMVIVPWCVWVSVSIFNQRQEIALLKQILSVLMNGKGPVAP